MKQESIKASVADPQLRNKIRGIAGAIDKYILSIRTGKNTVEPKVFSNALYKKIGPQTKHALPLRFRTWMRLAETVGAEDALPYLLAASRHLMKELNGENR